MPDQLILVSLLLRFSQNESLNEDECYILQDWLERSASNKELIEYLSSGNIATAESILQKLQGIRGRKR